MRKGNLKLVANLKSHFVVSSAGLSHFLPDVAGALTGGFGNMLPALFNRGTLG